jgi:hypothetical protein
MSGKNTAAFGIYESRADVEYAVDVVRAEGFRNTDVSVLFPENKGTKDFAVEKTPKCQKGQQAGPPLVVRLAESWAGWWGSAPWHFQAWVR